jgi:glutamate racemase
LNTAPIGVFDSGIGGLSILRALRAELPHEDFVYVADSAHAPYGERDDGFVVERAHAIVQALLARYHIKALVVACNTATAAAIHLLRQQYPELPIIGVEPALKPAAQQSRTGRVGVMATRGTLNSAKFLALRNALREQADFICQPCDGLASAIENDDAARIQALCQQYTQAMGRFGQHAPAIDTLVLGCTHYPFVADTLQSLLGPAVVLVESGAPVARQTRRVLQERGGLSPRATPGEVTFCATGPGTDLQRAVARWLHLPAHIETLKPSEEG